MSTRLRLYANPLRQLVAGSTWRAAWFLLAYLVWGWLLWAAVLTSTLTAAVLCITLAGIPLLVAAAGVIRGCANAERWRLHEVLAGPVHGGYRAVQRPGILGQVRTRWSDPATWRDFAYLFALFPLLWTLDYAVIVVWLVLLGGITVPVWYRYVPQTFNNGHSAHGLQFGYFPNGPSGRGSWGWFVGNLHQALIAAGIFLVLFLLFNYVLVGTARLHTKVAVALLRAPADPMAAAKEVLTRPGPLGPLHPEPLHTQPMHPAN
jgi:Putative sensor